jgi:tRNA modification GTPase
MFTEATLDFPDEDLDLLREGEVAARLAAIRERLARVSARARSGALLRAGLTMVLVGAPNVGKSSLLNRLVGEDAAIVTPIPGTTRDTVERQVEIGGIPLTIIDTAGLRETEDVVERLGMARTRSAIERADVALVLVDARDDAVAGAAMPELAALTAELPATLPRFIVHNKCDLARIAPHVEHREPAPTAVATAGAGAAAQVWLCALTGEGVALLEAEVLRIVGVEHAVEDAFFARARQLAALADTGRHLEIAATHVATTPPPLELFAEELRYAQNAISAITGEFTADDLLGEIFSRFCIGK